MGRTHRFVSGNVCSDRDIEIFGFGETSPWTFATRELILYNCILFVESKFHSFVNSKRKLILKKGKNGEKLLGSQARWRVIPRSHALISTQGEVIRPPTPSLNNPYKV